MAEIKKKKHNPNLLGRPKWSPLLTATLWSRNAGRCAICNKILYENTSTGDKVNIGQFAHIIAFRDGGPRADELVPESYKQDVSNIMLLCHACHKTVDSDAIKYTATILKEIKARHEEKIKLQTAPTSNRQRRIFIFEAPVATQITPIRVEDTVEALFPEQFPMNDHIHLTVPMTLESESDHEYWQRAKDFIDVEFKCYIYRKLDEFPKLAIFGMAPQPLLLYLGWKIGDKYNHQIFQRHRSQEQLWKWLQKNITEPSFQIVAPTGTEIENIRDDSRIVLSLSVSFDISARVQSYLNSKNGDLHWQIRTIREPSTEYVSSENQLHEFQQLVLKVLNDISQKVGRKPIHLYLAVPVSLAVAFGMSILPKATSEIIIYDYIKAEDKDVEAITINFNDGI